ncbi:MAG: protein-methionine-sulfoxide reductase heme-binding subunit MsrQ [Burkholderiaceae bacterium]
MRGSPSPGAASVAHPTAAAVDAVRLAVFAAALLPLARLFWLGFNDGLGANPVEFVTRSTGTWTLVMLCLTLSVTPLRRLLGWAWLLRLRRMLGLYAFFYGCLHFATYIWLDQWFDVPAMLADIVKRPFITAGFAAFVLMLPLAATSTKAMMRRLGRRWQTLHRLVYAVACLGVLHYAWHKGGKNDLSEPLVYAVVVAVLLGARLLLRGRASGRGQSVVGRVSSGAREDG